MVSDYLPIFKKKKNIYVKKKEKENKLENWFLDFIMKETKEKNAITKKEYCSFKSNIKFLKDKNISYQNLSLVRGKEVIEFLKLKKNLGQKLDLFNLKKGLDFDIRKRTYQDSRYNPSFKLFNSKHKFKFLSNFVKRKLLSVDKLRKFYLNLQQNNRIFFLLRKSKKYLYNYGPTLRFAKKFVGRRINIKKWFINNKNYHWHIYWKIFSKALSLLLRRFSFVEGNYFFKFYFRKFSRRGKLKKMQLVYSLQNFFNLIFGQFYSLLGLLSKSFIFLKGLSKITIVPVEKRNAHAILIFRFIIQQLSFKKNINQIVFHLLREFERNRAFSSSIRGVKILTNGRFTRSDRALKTWRVLGVMPRNTVSAGIEYFIGTFKSTFGTGVIRLWINRSMPEGEIIQKKKPIFKWRPGALALNNKDNFDWIFSNKRKKN